MRIKKLLAAVLTLACAVSAQAKTYNVVVDYFADPTGAADSAAAFRNAVAQVQTDGGGTVYVPAGNYLFSTKDATITNANVVIKRGGVHIVGDSQGGVPGGVGIAVTTTGSDVFYLYDESTNMMGGLYSPPSGTLIENIRISRHGITGQGTGTGIRIITDNTSGWASIDSCVVRSVTIDYGSIGVASVGGTNRSLLTHMLIDGCTIRNNAGDGVYIEDFAGLKIVNSEFRDNGGYGVRLLTFASTTSGANGGPVGGAFISGCRMLNNTSSGLSCRGDQSIVGNNLIDGVHVLGCQMTGGVSNGFTITQASNVEVAGCTLSENQGASAGNIGACTGVTITGCTFRGNYARGLQVATSSVVSVGSCVFRGNSASSAGAYYALAIVNGATNQSYSNLTFTGAASGGTQTLGVILLGNGTAPLDPVGILLQGLNFEGSMTTVLAESGLTGTQKYRMDFLSPQNWTAATPPSTYNGVMQFIEH